MKLEQYWPGALADHEVHIWHLAAGEQSKELLNHTDCLSNREKDKSNNFILEKDRLGYITRRVFLRKVLACYLDVACDQIKFTENDYGKPFIEGSINPQSLQFSLSKSHDHVLLAITQHRLIGCDIEKYNEALDYKTIIDKFFSAQEINYILGSSNQQTCFFDYWSAKEAYIKARGEGLSLPLDQFTLHIDNNEYVTMLENIFDQQDIDKWHIQCLKIDTGFSAAVAIKGKLSIVKMTDMIKFINL